MHGRTRLGTAIAHDDLLVVSEVAMMRLPLRAAETHRLERMREVLEAETELSRALAAHAHCGLVNFRGSHGTGDLRGETEALGAALDRYAALIQTVAGEYRHLMDAPAPSLSLVSSAESRPMLVAG